MFTSCYCQQLTPCKKNKSLNKIFWGSQFLYSDDFWLITRILLLYNYYLVFCAAISLLVLTGTSFLISFDKEQFFIANIHLHQWWKELKLGNFIEVSNVLSNCVDGFLLNIHCLHHMGQGVVNVNQVTWLPWL